MIRKLLTLAAVIGASLLVNPAFSQKIVPVIIKADKPLAEIQPTMWGIFFEDINFAADGGLYAELVKNRSFEFSHPMMGWKIMKEDSAAGSLLINNREETNPANPRYAHVQFNNDSGRFGIRNYGFRGMGIKKDLEYHFSIRVSNKTGNVSLKIELVGWDGTVIGYASLRPEEGPWDTYAVSFNATGTDAEAHLDIWFEGAGSLDMDMVSLFPADTWKNRPGGLRADLVQLLADLKPGFLRFPGGCIVEGRDLATRYQWKRTIGDAENRKMIVNRWNTEFNHRPAPDYFQSFGLGFFEYFQLAEDIGAEPLPILNCGQACQYNTAEVVPMDQIGPYIQDALDLIEFANGSDTSTWGKIRAGMGHPEPFNLRMLGIGNEQWGPQYIERYKAFASAIKARYPDICLVSGTGPSPEGQYFDFAATQLKKLKADIVDEHYYRNPEWFLQNATRYDHYDRNGYKIFAGEYAAQSVATGSPLNKNTWYCALSEAAFMTGLERNADVVYMSSYAPLFAHTGSWQWTPDLIWFDNLSCYGTPSYYVQKLYSTHRGTYVLPVSKNNQPLAGQSGLYASASLDDETKEIILKVVNAAAEPQTAYIKIETSKRVASKGKQIVLESKEKDAENSIRNPANISLVEREFPIKDKTLQMSFGPYSFSVLRVKFL
jgi:alpha-N-arabinofuranosidase